MALKSTLYSLWMETKTSEQASRRLAMENATDNAEELKEKLAGVKLEEYKISLMTK